jgi:hypothetical protein
MFKLYSYNRATLYNSFSSISIKTIVMLTSRVGAGAAGVGKKFLTRRRIKIVCGLQQYSQKNNTWSWHAGSVEIPGAAVRHHKGREGRR